MIRAVSNLLPRFHSAKKSVPVDGGELHVLIKEANNLIAMKAAGLSDTFVKGLDLIPSLCLFGAILRSPCPCMPADLCCSVTLQLLASKQIKEHEEEDSGGEEEPGSQLQPHVCVRRADCGAAEGDVPGADRVGQGGHAEQRVPRRSSPQQWER